MIPPGIPDHHLLCYKKCSRLQGYFKPVLINPGINNRASIHEEFDKAGLFEITEVNENYPFYLIKCKKTLLQSTRGDAAC